jgi:hypothetical protein
MANQLEGGIKTSLTDEEHTFLGAQLEAYEEAQEEHGRMSGLGELTQKMNHSVKMDMKSMQPMDKLAALNQLRPKANTRSFGDSREAFFSRLKQLPISMQKEVLDGNLAMCDSGYYDTQDVPPTSNRIQVFKPSDTQTYGLTNLTNSRLDALYYFVPLWIQFTFSNTARTTPLVERTFTPANFSDIYLLSAEMELKMQSQYLMKAFPLWSFYTTGNSDKNKGIQFTYQVDNPKMLKQLEVLEVNLQFFDPVSSPAPTRVVTGVRCTLTGTGLIKA